MRIINPISPILLLLVLTFASISQSLATESEQCVDCHANEVSAWQSSHHHKAMLEANEKTVLGNFDSYRFEDKSGWTLFTKQSEGYFIETGQKGEPGNRYRVRYVLGYYPLQQILVDIGKGRLQAYTVSWDARPKEQGGQRWYNLYEDSHSIDSPFYWKGQFNNWNARCAQCHSTDLKRGYDVATDSYNTTWKEINVSCEACHGDASKHILLKKQEKSAINSGFAKPLRKKHTWTFEEGKTTATIQKESSLPLSHGQVDDCAACHSRRTTLLDGGVRGNFEQHYIPRIAVPDLYHADGQILDEVYVYGSFSQSKMSAAGVSCSHCHDPHTAKVITLENPLCTQCHLPSEYDTKQHTLHKVGTSGSKCIDCHMPYETYMGIDDRRDHAYRIPNPWVSEALNSKDICLDCHQDKDTDWSQAQLADKKQKIFGDYSDIGPAILLNAYSPEEGQANLQKLVADPTQPEMRRAVLASHLDASNRTSIEALYAAANGDSSLVKLGVIQALEGAPFQVQIQVAFGLLYDEAKNVRMDAIRLLAPALKQNIPADARQALEKGLYESITTYQKQQDLLSAQLAMANLAYNVGQAEQAKTHYENAIRLQPNFLPAKVNLASIYRETGDTKTSKQVLNQVLSVEPEHALALFNLGLVNIVEKEIESAVSNLGKAAHLSPDNLRFGFTYLLALERKGDINAAQKELNRLKLMTPNDPMLKQVEARLRN